MLKHILFEARRRLIVTNLRFIDIINNKLCLDVVLAIEIPKYCCPILEPYCRGRFNVLINYSKEDGISVLF